MLVRPCNGLAEHEMTQIQGGQESCSALVQPCCSGRREEENRFLKIIVKDIVKSFVLGEYRLEDLAADAAFVGVDDCCWYEIGLRLERRI